MTPHNFGLEWQTLQGNFEQLERTALFIKLVSVSVCIAGIAAHAPFVWLALAIGLFWLQEGIVKAYQGRLTDRMLKVEALLATATFSMPAFQLHTEWRANRPGAATLSASYIYSACKPTVAFTYIPLLIGLAIEAYF